MSARISAFGLRQVTDAGLGHPAAGGQLGHELVELLDPGAGLFIGGTGWLQFFRSDLIARRKVGGGQCSNLGEDFPKGLELGPAAGNDLFGARRAFPEVGEPIGVLLQGGVGVVFAQRAKAGRAHRTGPLQLGLGLLDQAQLGPDCGQLGGCGGELFVQFLLRTLQLGRHVG
jgi:hypothetical protein